MKLRSKLPLFLAPLVIAPLLLVSGIAVERMRTNAEQNMLGQMTSLANQITLNAETATKTMEANAVLFSGSGLLKNYIFMPQEERYYFALLPLLNLFSSYQKAYPEYEEIRVILPDGTEDARFSAADAPNLHDNEAHAHWFQVMEQTKTVTKSFFQWNPDTGKPTMVVAHRLEFVDPTFEDSTANAPSHRGYLVITVSLESMLRLVADTGIGSQGGIMILDTQGRALHQLSEARKIPDATSLFSAAESAARSGVEETVSHGKNKLLIHARKLPGDLLLVSYLPEKELVQAGRELGRIVVFIGIGAVLIAVGLLMLILQYIIVRPLSELGAGAESIGAGNLDTRLNVQGHDEVSLLAHQFNTMATSLLESHRLRDEAQAEALRLKELSIESLRAADKLKDEFLANTSHELRTPLHGMSGIAESLLNGAAGPISPGVQENLELLLASSRRLSQLVNDILDYSKLRHKDIKLVMRPVDLRSSCSLVISMVRVLAQAKQISIENTIPEGFCMALVDENRIHQILYNLLGNAVKFTPRGQVTVSAVEEKGMIRVDVADTGVGIPKDKRETVFASFEQLDGGLERTQPGTGLGLAITRQLVEAHGGRIAVTENPAGGSTFSFTLKCAPRGQRRNDQSEPAACPTSPLQAPAASMHSAAEVGNKNDKPGKGRHLLVVDDEPINLRVIKNHLEMNGYRVSTAISGLEARTFLREQGDTCDLVLLDVMMPGLSGYQVCEELRTTYKADHLPVIFLTALTRDGDIERGFAAGGNDYIPKPFSYNELLARIRIHITLSSQSRDLSRLNKDLEQRVQDRTSALQRAYSDMERLANIDGLTGVRNRRALDIALEEMWADCQKSAAPISYLLADIDYFKKYNDHYGHQAGDLCLREVASILEEVAERHGGTMGRYGGEEFCLIFPAPLETALKAARAGLQAVQDRALEHSESLVGVVTISIGGATGTKDVTSPQHLIKAADTALYKAKQSGRNRVEYMD